MIVLPDDGGLPPVARRSRPVDAVDPGNSGRLVAIHARLEMWDPNGNRLGPENIRVSAPVADQFHLSLGEH